MKLSGSLASGSESVSDLLFSVSILCACTLGSFSVLGLSFLSGQFLEIWCYGRSTVVSDVDNGVFVLNVDGGRMQELDYVEVRTTERLINTQGEDDEKAKNANV
jgi:hypothetical protein